MPFWIDPLFFERALNMNSFMQATTNPLKLAHRSADAVICCYWFLDKGKGAASTFFTFDLIK